VDAYGKTVNLDTFAHKSAQSTLQTLLACAHTESALQIHQALYIEVIFLFYDQKVSDSERAIRNSVNWVNF